MDKRLITTVSPGSMLLAQSTRSQKTCHNLSHPRIDIWRREPTSDRVMFTGLVPASANQQGNSDIQVSRASE